MAKYIDDIIELARQALTEEVDTTPKPGLVDRFNSGAHKDMDYNTFIRSIDAIIPYLYQMAVVSTVYDDDLPLRLKTIGISAEQAMYRATNDVNTHKGAIFALSLTIGATISTAINNYSSLDTVQNQISNMARALLPYKATDTKGHAVTQKYKLGGAFGQALDGYRKVLNLTLPLYESYETLRLDSNEQNIRVLLHLMTYLDDTNVYHRIGEDGYKNALEKVGAVLDNYSCEAVKCLCMDFDNNNISFGGCADMLMLSIFVKKLIKTGYIHRN